MSGKKSGRVPVLDDAFEINLAKLLAVSRQTGRALLKVSNGTISGEVLVMSTKLGVRLEGQVFCVDLIQAQCLKGRSRTLSHCPRAHEGNFQSLYYWNGDLACRHCHRLRYQSNLAASAADRARLARNKLLLSMGGQPGAVEAPRKAYQWRSRHDRLAARLTALTGTHFKDMRAWLERQKVQ